MRGIVQGVGFRPTVWRMARENGLRGQVWNDAEGVLIHLWATPEGVERFTQQLLNHPPPLARIESIERTVLERAEPVPESFEIVKSAAGVVGTSVPADTATCPECLLETLNPRDRRYRYPFTNCTHCGPRLSIVKAIPYDRSNTSMSTFPLCPQCLEEYENPADRRFHAQPNACSRCGPVAWLEDRNGARVTPETGEDAVQAASRLIRSAHIVAIKGLGGVHLCCDASNARVVSRLRRLKRRYQKALALMGRDIEMIRRFTRVSGQEAVLLEQRSAPIVVLDTHGEPLPEALAPGQNTLGFMLPYTPLHHLLMLDMQQPVVMTSGNLSEEPQTIANSDARKRLGEIADYFLMHDREIVNRLDDSVQRVMDGEPRMLRRARGYAPLPFILNDDFQASGNILAMGGELKNTFCLLKDGRAIVSQHIGDLEEVATQEDFRYNLDLYQHIFDFHPDRVVIDHHPDYLSSQLGQLLAQQYDSELVEVQHHHAHIAACMAEYGMGINGPGVLGVALDGLGMGEDGQLWGGEFLHANYTGFKRLAHFKSTPMLGAAQAMREPWRNTFAHLHQTLGWERVERDYRDLDIVYFLNEKPLTTLQQMARRGLNSPMSSSCGRLFDAVAAAIGVCREEVQHEGQAAIELEALAAAHIEAQAGQAYPCSYVKEGEGGVLSWGPLWEAILADLKLGVPGGLIAARFHLGLAQAVSRLAVQLCETHELQHVVLSGGVFQNRLLLELVSERIRRSGRQVFAPLKFPANDGGLSLGQVVIAAARRLQG